MTILTFQDFRRNVVWSTCSRLAVDFYVEINANCGSSIADAKLHAGTYGMKPRVTA